jgi:hypothetical protein
MPGKVLDMGSHAIRCCRMYADAAMAFRASLDAGFAHAQG